MGLFEFTEKFRVYHPTIPEAYYGKVAKMVPPTLKENTMTGKLRDDVVTVGLLI